MNGWRAAGSGCTVCTVRCGYGAVVRVAHVLPAPAVFDVVNRRMRLTPRADQLNRGDAPMRLTLAFPLEVFDVGRRCLEGLTVGRFCLPKCREGRT